MPTWRAVLLVTLINWQHVMSDAQQQQQQKQRHQQQAQCTTPHPPDSALKPFCFTPDTISGAAQEHLRTSHTVPAANMSDPAAVAAARAGLNAAAAPLSEAAARQYLQEVWNETIGGVPVARAKPKGLKKRNDNKVLVCVHGGAFTQGSCYHKWHVTAMVAQAAGIPVVCIEYSLAPEYPFPKALNDAMAVYKTLLKRYKPQNIAFIGESAGGGLVLSLLLQAKQQQLPVPGALLLMSPWSDLAKTGDTLTTLTAVDPMLQYELNLQGSAVAYVGGDSEKLQDPWVSPLRAAYAAPFPPTLIQAGLRDSILSQATLLYRKLNAAGLQVEFSPWEAMWHVFQSSLVVPEAQQANQELARFLVKQLKL